MAKLSNKKIQQVKELITGGLTHRQISAECGVSVGVVSNIRRAMTPAAPTEEPVHRKPEFSTPPKKKVPVLEVLARLAERTRSHNSEIKDYASASIKATRPIAVMKAADLHLGGMDVDYDALKAHYDFLLNTDDFYLQLFGDDINMMIMHRSVSSRHDILTPNEQIELLENIVDELFQLGKIISVGWGNHSDEFTERNAGFGLVKRLVGGKVPYFRGIGYLDLNVGDYTYPMAFAHKTRFNSFMNPTHGNKRMEQQHAELFGPSRPIAREYITAHTHNPAFAVHGCLPSERIYYIKCGTFKTNCVYSQRYFGQGRIGVPTVVYHPDRMEHVCFPTPWEAHRYMKGEDVKQ